MVYIEEKHLFTKKLNKKVRLRATGVHEAMQVGEDTGVTYANLRAGAEGRTGVSTEKYLRQQK